MTGLVVHGGKGCLRRCRWAGAALLQRVARLAALVGGANQDKPRDDKDGAGVATNNETEFIPEPDDAAAKNLGLDDDAGVILDAAKNEAEIIPGLHDAAVKNVRLDDTGIILDTAKNEAGIIPRLHDAAAKNPGLDDTGVIHGAVAKRRVSRESATRRRAR